MDDELLGTERESLEEMKLPGDSAVQEMIEGIVSQIMEQSIEQRLRFGSPFHDKILGRLINRRDLGRRWFEDREADWDDVDDFMKMRVDLSAGARLGDKTRSETKREMPVDRSVVIPASFAMTHVRATQAKSVLLARDLQIEGVGPEDVSGAKLMEVAIAYDSRVGRWPMAVHQMVWDTEKYGQGIWYITFEKKYGWKYSAASSNPLAAIFPGLMSPGREWTILREFGQATPVDPRRFYRDPRVPFARMHEGEFIGHGRLQGFMSIKERDQSLGGPYFNVDEVKKHCGAGGDKSSRWKDLHLEKADELDRGPFCVDHLQVKLIPKEWELGPSEKPEIWWFTWVDDGVIVRAHPNPFWHQEFSYSAAESIPDYHTSDNPGFGEQMIGLQLLIDWLYNVRIDNVRRTLNNSLIYSPLMLNELDVLNPMPGGHVRLTQKATQMIMDGRMDIRQAFAQLSVQDVTASHLNDVQFAFEMMQRMMAANDPQQGIQLKDKRTLGEVQTIMASASQRIMDTTRGIDSQAIVPAVMQMIKNRQQLTEVEQWYRVAGDLAQELQRFDALSGKIQMANGTLQAYIKSEDLAGEFDYIPITSTTASDPSRQSDIFMQIAELAAKIPQLVDPAQSPDGRVLDVREVINQAIRNAGVKNIEQFYRAVQDVSGAALAGPQNMPNDVVSAINAASAPPRVVPDEEYMRNVEAGNYVTPEGQ